jgi:hypothetical protein
MSDHAQHGDVALTDVSPCACEAGRCRRCSHLTPHSTWRSRNCASRSLTQEELATQAGTTVGTVSQLETAKSAPA